jgi:hypothetical protein
MRKYLFALLLVGVPLLFGLGLGLGLGGLVHRAFPAVRFWVASLWSGLSVLLVFALTFWGWWRYDDFKKRRERQVGIRSSREIHSDPAIENLIRELIRIPRYLGTPGGIYDDNGQHKRAREIGEILFNEGGHGLMVRAAKRVINSGSREGEISSCWHGIGHWQA